jgi:hypothetical protein
MNVIDSKNIKEGSYKYVVNVGFKIAIFPKSYGHWQFGSLEHTLYGGFLEINDFGTVANISEKGSESLNKPSIHKARDKDIFYFIDLVNNGEFELIK